MNLRNAPIWGLCFFITLFTFLPDESHAQRKKNRKAKAAKELVETIELTSPIKGPSVEGITEYTLANGLKVLLFPDKSQQNITVNITYLVGSRHEGYGETGMAHLLEHMVFKGSTNHTNIPKELSDHGCRPNGTTWLDRTNYYETFTANEENLDWALDLEADRMVNSFIKNEDLQSEFTVVRNEFEMGENNPGSVLQEKIVSAGYLWHNYGNSTIGSREDLENVPINKLKDFYKKYYQPDNAVLLVAGKIDEAKTLKLINEKFGPIPRPTRKIDETYTVEPTQDGEKFVELKRVGDVQMLGAMYHISSGTHKDYAPLEVLVDMVTDEPSGMLYKALIDGKKASSQYGYTFQLRDPGIAYFSVELTKDKSLEEAQDTFLSSLDKIATTEFTQVELDRVKTKTLKQFEQLSKNTEVFGKILTEFIAKGDWRTIFLYRDAIENVTLEEVHRVAKEYFKTSNRTYGVFIPSKEDEIDRVKIPASPDVNELVKDYKGRELVAMGEEFDPSFENIESRTHRGDLKEGMQYAFLPKKTKGEVVNAIIKLNIGNEESLKNLGITDNFTADMLMKGTSTLNRQEILDSLNKIKTNIRIYGGGSNVTASLSSTKEYLPTALKILADLLKNPTFDEEEFSKLKEERKAQIESKLSDPMAIASNLYSRTLSPYPKGDVRYTPTFEEESEFLEQVTPAKMKEFHSNFYGANNADISIVGDFDEESIKTQLLEDFGNWDSKVPYERLKSTYFANPSKSESVNTPDKPNALFLAGITMPLKDTHPDYPALIVGNYLLGGGFLNSRLAVRIRQKEGISYGVGSQMSASSEDDKAQFTTYAIYAPENAERLEAAFVEELNKVRNEGFTEDELQKAKEGMVQANTVGRAKDNELGSKLNNYLKINRTLDYDKDFEEKVNALTLDQVNNVFRKYIDPAKVTMVKAGDFNKKVEAKDVKEEPATIKGSN